jgi:hypothetical protein
MEKYLYEIKENKTMKNQLEAMLYKMHMHTHKEMKNKREDIPNKRQDYI